MSAETILRVMGALAFGHILGAGASYLTGSPLMGGFLLIFGIIWSVGYVCGKITWKMANR